MTYSANLACCVLTGMVKLQYSATQGFPRDSLALQMGKNRDS